MRRSGHRSLHRAPSARNSGPPHRRRFYSLPRDPLFHFRRARDEEGAEPRKESKGAQLGGRYREQSPHNHFRSTGLAAHFRKEVPIPHRNESYRQTASAATSGS